MHGTHKNKKKSEKKWDTFIISVFLHLWLSVFRSCILPLSLFNASLLLSVYHYFSLLLLSSLLIAFLFLSLLRSCSVQCLRFHNSDKPGEVP